MINKLQNYVLHITDIASVTYIYLRQTQSWFYNYHISLGLHVNVFQISFLSCLCISLQYKEIKE